MQGMSKKTSFFTAKMQFFSKNVIFDQKKSACGKPPAEKNGLFPKETLFLQKKKSACGNRPGGGEKSWSKFWSKKSACGKPPGGGKWFFPRETLFWAKKRRRRVKKNAKNIKIGLKRVPVRAFWMSPGPKCTEKQDLQPRNGDIAPKPLK